MIRTFDVCDQSLVEGGSFFESARWHHDRWWFSDFYQHRVIAVDVAGTVEEVLAVDGQPSGIGWLPDGSMLVVSMLDRRIVRLSVGGEVSTYADLAALVKSPLNDLVVDPRGYAFVGSLGFDPRTQDPRPAALVRIDPDGRAVICDDDLWIPNGMVVTDDGRTLIAAETLSTRFLVWDLAPDGSLANRRVWAAFGEIPTRGTMESMLGSIPVAPDGCTIDAEGQIWVADTIHGRCLRVASGGVVTGEVVLRPGLGAYACALGGSSGATLAICAAPYGIPRNGSDEARILTTEVDVPGREWA